MTQTTDLHAELKRLERAKANPGNSPALALHIDRLLARVRTQLPLVGAPLAPEPRGPAPVFPRRLEAKERRPLVLSLKAEGLSDRAIAIRLGVDPKTVRLDLRPELRKPIPTLTRARQTREIPKPQETAKPTLESMAEQLQQMSERLQALEARQGIDASAARLHHARELARIEAAAEFHRRALAKLGPEPDT